MARITSSGRGHTQPVGGLQPQPDRQRLQAGPDHRTGVTGHRTATYIVERSPHCRVHGAVEATAHHRVEATALHHNVSPTHSTCTHYPAPTPFKQKRSGPHRIETLNAHGASSSNGRVHSPRAVRPLSLPPPTPLSTAAGARHPVLAAQGRGLGPELCGKRPARILRRSVALLSLWERQCLPVARVTLHCLFTAFPCICNDSSLPCTFIRIDLPAYSFFAGLSSLCERHQNKSRALGWSSHLQSHRTDTNPGCLANPIP